MSCYRVGLRGLHKVHESRNQNPLPEPNQLRFGQFRPELSKHS